MARTIILFLVVVASVIGWITYQQSRMPPFVVSGMIEADEIRVGSRIGGRVGSVHVEEGDRVAKDAPIYELDPFDLRDQLAHAEAQFAAAQAEFNRLKSGYRAEEIEQARARRDLAEALLQKSVAGPRPQEISVAREQLKSAQAVLELAESEYARLERLKEDRQAAPKEFDAAVSARKAALADAARAEQQLSLLEEGTRKEDIAAATAQRSEAQQALKMLEAGYRAEDIARAEAQLSAARAQAEAIKVQLSELSVRSPCDCVVEVVDLRPGDLVSPNAPSTALLDLSRMWVRAYVPEGRLGHIKLGQAVALRVIGLPDRLLRGSVTYIARSAEFTPRNVQTPEERSKQVFRIKVTLDTGLTDVRVGMSADVLFDEEPPK